MAYLEEQEWMILNEIGYKISSTYEIDRIYHNIFDWLGLLVGYESGIFSFVRATSGQSHEKYELENISCRNIPEEYVKIWLGEMKRSNTAKLIIYGARKTAYKVSDFLSEEKKKEANMYRFFYKPLDLFYSMGMCIVFDEEPIAMIQLYRKKEQKDFSDRDLFVLSQLQKHIAYRMYYETKKCDVKYFYAEAYQEKIYEKYGLTGKERQVFEHAVGNLSNEEIADKMNISIHTVKKHFHSIYTKMGVTNRIQLLQDIPQKEKKA